MFAAPPRCRLTPAAWQVTDVYTPVEAAFPVGQLIDTNVSAGMLIGNPHDINAFALEAVQLNVELLNGPAGDVAVRSVIVTPLTVE